MNAEKVPEVPEKAAQPAAPASQPAPAGASGPQGGVDTVDLIAVDTGMSELEEKIRRLVKGYMTSVWVEVNEFRDVLFEKVQCGRDERDIRIIIEEYRHSVRRAIIWGWIRPNQKDAVEKLVEITKRIRSNPFADVDELVGDLIRRW